MSNHSTKVDDGSLPETVSGPDLARLIGITDRQVRVLASEGVIVRAGRGRYDLTASLSGYIASVGAKAGGEAEAARVAFMRSKQVALDLANAEKMRELIPVEDHHAALDIVTGSIKAAVMGWPARVTRDRTIRAALDAEVAKLLNDTAARIERAAAAIASDAGMDQFLTEGEMH